MRAAAILALALAACSGDTGTVTVSLTTAPGSTVLDGVQTLRMTLTDPHQVTSATRGSAGFDLSIEIDAKSSTGALIVEGLDAGGKTIAVGQSPAFPLAAITAKVVVYMAAPMSIAKSPVGLGTARTEVTGSALSYGVVLAGGRNTAGAPTTDIGVYNAFDHSFAAGVAMPAARTGVAMTTNATAIYMFGGTGPDENPTGTLWLFDTTVSPGGAFTSLLDEPSHARTGQLMLPIPAVGYPITGDPALLYNGTALNELGGSLPAVGGGGKTTSAAAYVGETLIQLKSGVLSPITGAGRTGAAATTRSDGKVLVVGGGAPQSLDGMIIDPDAGTVTVVPDALPAGRTRPAIAATSRHLVVIGGTDAGGAPINSADILDVTTLAPIITVPLDNASGVYAVALPNDQVLITGGAPATSDIQLFTPDAPAATK